MPIVSPRPSLIIFQDTKPLKGEKNSEKHGFTVFETLLEEEKICLVHFCEGILKSHSLSSLLNYLRAFGDRSVAEVPGGQGIESCLACLKFEPSAPKTRRVGQRCTLNLSRAEMSCRWCGVVVRRGGASSGVTLVI
ncbi:hypothetical protein TNCV_2682381 [Trichonephila clavipes]|nr:hypothetical protein TNCV_2682381 [Trichonephila clavipes]